MELTNFHTHTTYCDGKHSPEEVVLSAIEKGFDAIGLSEHAYIYYDEPESMAYDKTLEYIDVINGLKEKYKDKIEVFCGTEWEYYADRPQGNYDYIIGSLHYLKCDAGHFVVDCTKEMLMKACEEHFGGDYYAVCENYYSALSDVVNKTDCDIIGHFDLISKFNEDGSLYDETHPRYVAAVKKALDALIPRCRLFEVNTGAISRKVKTKPYPAEWILKEIHDRGGKVILSSDSHHKDTIDCCFDEAREICYRCGFTDISTRFTDADKTK